MGASESIGLDNDELVDNLMMSKYIKTKQVERVFRAVDRGDYVLPSHRDNIYRDLAWKRGNIHLSAPCVYSQVMEGLSLEPGQSFLNLGSGTGYLSTMAGLILNQHGTNHGIELHEDCIIYANKRLEEFKQMSLALDEFDFCEPLFVQGNCLSVAPGRQYDRVYCGAACPESHEAFIKQFVRVGGILVMPFKDELLRIQKTSEHTWLQEKLLPVSFAPLIVPAPSEHTLFHLPECCPLSLQELCRGKIRHRLRQNVWHEHVELETRKPIFEESESDQESDEESDEDSDVENHSNWQNASNNDGNHQLNADSAKVDSEDTGNKEGSNKVESFLNSVKVNVVESSSGSVQGGSEGQNQRPDHTNNTEDFEKLTKDSYSRVNETDSDPEQEEDALVQRKKVPKRDIESTDTDIVEDVSLSNEDGSSSSNANSQDCSPHLVLDELSCHTMSNSFKSNSRDEVILAHYVDNNAFSTYMKEKIHQLPLPFSLKLYMNYYRKL